MALETITGRSKTADGSALVYSNKLAENESITGFFIGFKKGKFESRLIVLQAEDGSLMDVTTTGNLYYLEKDGVLTRGALTVITKTGTRPSKKKAGETVPVFQVQQDKEKTIVVAEETTATSSVEERLAKIKAKSAQELVILAQPNKEVALGFQHLFPLLLYYFAALRDEENQGDYSTDMSWDDLCNQFNGKVGFKLSRSQLESLVYNYKIAVADKRFPYRALSYRHNNYSGLLKDLRYLYPNLFVENIDGEINFADTEYVESE